MTEERQGSARGRELGEELRRVRRRAGLTGVALARELEWSSAKVSKLEKGWRGTGEGDIGAFLGRCGADKVTRRRVLGMAVEPDLGWFVRPHRERPADELTCLAVHERSAVTVTCYEPFVVPSLLQTDEYARALTDGDPEPRLRRQRDLGQAVCVFYVHEAAFCLPVGDAAVMHGQMVRLAFAADSTVLRVIPVSAGNHRALRHPATVLTFDKDVTALAFAEIDAATVFLDDDRAVKAYQDKHAVLDGLALDTGRSHETLIRWAEVYAR